MKRREILQWLALAPSLLTVGGRVFAAPSSSPRFLLVFLRGGYDCANVLVPYSSDFYYQARPTIAVPKPAGTESTGAVKLDGDWALAPALRQTLAPLYSKGEALFIPFAGTEDLSRSHFETQDSIELGQPAEGTHDLRSGFLARLAQTLNGQDAKPIAFTDSLPVCFRGAAEIPNVSLKAVGKPAFDARQAEILASMYAGSQLEAAVTSGLELRQEIAQTFAAEMQEANRGAMAPKGFELEARRLARLMRGEFRIGFIDVGGWDTHVNEGGAEGALASNIESLGRGLEALSQELGAEWKNTVVVVLSEFGRTFRENGNKGTDHGHGSVHWVLGGSIAGGRIAGAQVKIEPGALFQDRDFPVLNEYRAVLAGLFVRMWGLSGEQLQTVFPSAVPADLKIV